MSSAKDLVRKSWDATSNKDMGEFLGWVMSSLRMRGQRVSAVVNIAEASKRGRSSSILEYTRRGKGQQYLGESKLFFIFYFFQALEVCLWCPISPRPT